jgi:DNA-binding transcriptional LysR family regulator
VLAHVDRTVDVMRRVGNGSVGRLTIGFVPSASNEALPAVLRAFRRERPEVELVLRELSPDELVLSLEARETDLGFLYLPLQDDALSWRPVASESLLAAVPAGHRLAAMACIDLADLAGESFILPPDRGGSGLRAAVMAACGTAGVDPKEIEKDHWLTPSMTAIVAAGVGVALVPESERLRPRGGVAYLELGDDLPVADLGVAWREDNRSPVLQALLRAVDEVSHDSHVVSRNSQTLLDAA